MINGHGGVELVQELSEDVLVVVVPVDGVGHLLQDLEEHLLRVSGQLDQPVVAKEAVENLGNVVEASKKKKAFPLCENKET